MCVCLVHVCPRGLYISVFSVYPVCVGLCLKSIHRFQQRLLPPSYLSARAAFPTGEGWGVLKRKKIITNQILAERLQSQQEGIETCHCSHQSRIFSTAESVIIHGNISHYPLCLCLAVSLSHRATHTHTLSQQKGRVS